MTGFVDLRKRCSYYALFQFRLVVNINITIQNRLQCLENSCFRFAPYSLIMDRAFNFIVYYAFLQLVATKTVKAMVRFPKSSLIYFLCLIYVYLCVLLSRNTCFLERHHCIQYRQLHMMDSLKCFMSYHR